MVHPDKLERYPGSLGDLAEEIGNLRYDALGEFLRLLAAKLDRDAALDEGRDRVRLATSLRETANLLDGAAAEARRAWTICEPHMGGDSRGNSGTPPCPEEP